MKIAMDMLCRVFSHALDIIEEEQIGASEHHSLRVAALCVAMGKRLGFDNDRLSALATCALFHDNALTEYRLSERDLTMFGENMLLHCEKGQNNLSSIPFKHDIDGIILYHHELGNGKGPFGKREDEYPFEAALVAAADAVDVLHRLQYVPAEKFPTLRDKIASRSEKYSSRPAINALLEVLDGDMLESLRNENISRTLDENLPRWEIDLNEPGVIGIASFVSRVIDFKSHFTHKHTSQIANRAWLIGKHYGYSHEELAALYLAASLHDIGKIATPIEILEKPGALNHEEFQIIKNHSRDTYVWLCGIPDFDLIRKWAADHHEKLDGSGYSFGKQGDELDFNTRLIACLDIYQAIGEPRPYHNARSHAETMPILYNMADRGLIDNGITKDLDDVMAEYSMRDVPFLQ